VAQNLKGFDYKTKKIIDIQQARAFYNTVLARSFEEVGGGKIKFKAVSFHRRRAYKLGEVPNKYAVQYAGGPVLLVTCTVDVHKAFLQVKITGWTRGRRNFLIEYLRFEDGTDNKNGCGDINSPAWAKLRKVIEEYNYTADDGKKYTINITGIDTQWKYETVVTFCAEYAQHVYPIRGIGGQQATRANVTEFRPFKTKAGREGFSLNVDYYKDRMQIVLRRQWTIDAGDQDKFHFNAPIDIPDKALAELTVEYKREKTDERTGEVWHYWHRPGNARNELWDLLGYSYAMVEIYAWNICTREFEEDAIDWDVFWDYLEGLTNDGVGRLFTV
jgi:phage terminase large subunit GpA-like protein